MRWTCEKCATRHETKDEIEACRRRERQPTLLAIAALALLFALAFIAKAVWAAYVYDDWTCAFAECRKIK